MDWKNNNITLSTDKLKNYITYDNIDFRISPLDDNFKRSKGGNSNVFVIKDPNDVYPDRIIKFCKSPIDSKREFDVKRLKRFKREITALELAKDKKNIIEYFFADEWSINRKTYKYYVMEKGEIDLKEYILNSKINIQDKVLFCKQIVNSLSELHDLKIYHRDIKPDNIFFVDEKNWKIGDLGLISYRNEDEILDYPNEMIGPRGWLSPEAMNKFLTFEMDTEFKFDCLIDDKSDVFQLGKLFWFIFQCNVPIGQLKKEDFYIKDNEIYDLLLLMLYHSKESRISLGDVKEKFKPLATKYIA